MRRYRTTPLCSAMNNNISIEVVTYLEVQSRSVAFGAVHHRRIWRIWTWRFCVMVNWQVRRTWNLTYYVYLIVYLMVYGNIYYWLSCCIEVRGSSRKKKTCYWGRSVFIMNHYCRLANAYRRRCDCGLRRDSGRYMVLVLWNVGTNCCDILSHRNKLFSPACVTY